MRHPVACKGFARRIVGDGDLPRDRADEDVHRAPVVPGDGDRVAGGEGAEPEAIAQRKRLILTLQARMAYIVRDLLNVQRTSPT